MKYFSKSVTIFIFLTYVLLTPLTPLLAQQQDKKKRIAVLDLQGEGITDAEAKTLTGRLRSKLVNTNAFYVLEREQMDQILSEQGFQQSGCVSDECLVEIGQMIGVEEMIGGSIGKIGSTYTLDLRIINVTTGRIVRTVSDDYQGDADGLLGVLENAAYVIAGDEKIETRSEGISWYYWVGAGLVAAGAVALLAGGDSAGSGSSSDLPEDDWLVGGNLGFHGSWGTAYPSNLRLMLDGLSEEKWLALARQMRQSSPMSWVRLPKVSEQDLRAVYRFVKYLGPKGIPAPDRLPAGVTPTTDYIEFPEPH